MTDHVETDRQSNKIELQQFLTQISIAEKIWFRKLERVARKLVSAKWRTIFLRACIKDKLMPRFITYATLNRFNMVER